LLAIEGEDVQGVYDLEEMNLIGRAADNTIQLDESTVSAYHARLSFNQGQWWLEDLGSRNGTYLNDIVVEEPLVVTYGDEIQFGKARYQLNSGRHHYETRPAGTTEEAPHRNADAPFPQHLD
jgi:pSer/pThr/pTyr-binding forkhead associated (FHA) protein